jgi:ATPase family associated with various cellular activities (AAA)
MGQVYYDMGFLSSSDVIECSASDLVGQYVGQTGPKTKQVFEKALGRVLFVDEAYRLSEGHFAKEAIDELVGILTQETFRSKLVVVLAGYDQEMNQLMAVNTGLSSRFPEEVVFRNMPPKQCLEVLRRELQNKNIHMDALSHPASAEYMKMAELIEELSGLASWGNARDLKTLSQQMIRLVLRSSSGGGSQTTLTLTGKDAVTCIETMLADRRERCTNAPTNSHPNSFSDMRLMPNTAEPPSLPTVATTQTIKSLIPEAKNEVTPEQQSDGRDVGVTDEVWRQLQADKEEEERASIRSIEELQFLEQELQDAVKQEEDDKALAKKLAKINAKNTAEEDELRRKREEMRLREYEARAERERIAAALEAKRQEEARQKQQEAKAQAALRKMGVCVAGFRWIKQVGGYRCAGGVHFVQNAELGI